MAKRLFILTICVLLITASCGAKDEIKQSNLTNKNAEKVEEETSKEKTKHKKDRSNEIKAPNFKLATLSGKEFNLSDFKGKVVLLNFWGTWCMPCRKEIPDLVNLQSNYNQDGLEIVGITLNSGSAFAIQKFADKKNINYTILTDIEDDETYRVTLKYGMAIGQQISAVPTTLIIDREGYIVKGYIGPRSEAVFYKDLKEYL